MSKAKRFAVAKDAAGNEVMQFFGPAAEDDPISVGLRILTCHLQRANPESGGGGGFGGEFGYGVRFENDVFLMHPYCWCDRDDCLWCGGSSCQGNVQQEPHREGCYQQRLQEFARKHGELLGAYDGREHWHVPYGSPHQRDYDLFKRRLCAQMNLDYHSGNEVHCSCGVDREWRERYDACDCDWHQGRGRFVFGKAASAPHFWHKASGFQVRWYKYIGRDNKVSDEAITSTAWLDMLTACLASIGVSALDEAIRIYADAERDAAEASRKAMEWAFSEEGQRFFDDAIESGAIKVFGFGKSQEGRRS